MSEPTFGSHTDPKPIPERYRFLHLPTLKTTLGLDPERKLLAIAKAGARDSWSRKLGREIVTGRLNSERPNVRGRFQLEEVARDFEGKLVWSATLEIFVYDFLRKHPGIMAENHLVDALSGICTSRLLHHV
jgi:hypothetical protein